MTELHAVLDVGSNTIRLLVGRVRDGDVDQVHDRSEFVRLGRGVDETGRLQPDREAAAIEAIRALATQARELGAGTPVAIATSAVRDAENGREFVDRVRDQTGVQVEIISGEREADLTFRGATIGVDVAPGIIVCDLGGGSAELIAANGDGIAWRTSEKLGSGRLTERFIHHDPPLEEEVASVRDHVRAVLDGLPPAGVNTVVFTGGTATHVAHLTGSSETMTRLKRSDLEGVLASLREHTAKEIADRYEVMLERAQVLPAGTAALLAIVEVYDPEEIVITRHGIREGAMLESAEG